MIFAILNSIFLICFVLSAVVQYNDTDAPVWIAMYLLAVAMCLAEMKHRQPRWMPPLLLFICLAWIGTLLPSIVGKVSLQEVFASISMQTREVEEAREIGGLAIVAIWAACIMIKRKYERSLL